MPIIEKTDSLENLAQQMLDLHKELQATSANTDKHNSLRREIEKLDREIDEVIYKLYGLNDEEIKIIES
jgi:type II restriction/modification system DNA methylase subunit YeeA